MEIIVKTYGRMELAQLYFPAIAPRSAWRRMKDLLRESSTTAELAEQSRRVFMPAEVSLIFETFGAPWQGDRRSTLSRLLCGVRPRVSGSPPKPPYQSAQDRLLCQVDRNFKISLFFLYIFRITMQSAIFGMAFAKIVDYETGQDSIHNRYIISAG